MRFFQRAQVWKAERKIQSRDLGVGWSGLRLIELWSSRRDKLGQRRCYALIPAPEGSCRFLAPDGRLALVLLAELLHAQYARPVTE